MERSNHQQGRKQYLESQMYLAKMLDSRLTSKVLLTDGRNRHPPHPGPARRDGSHPAEHDRAVPGLPLLRHQPRLRRPRQRVRLPAAIRQGIGVPPGRPVVPGHGVSTTSTTNITNITTISREKKKTPTVLTPHSPPPPKNTTKLVYQGKLCVCVCEADAIFSSIFGHSRSSNATGGSSANGTGDGSSSEGGSSDDSTTSASGSLRATTSWWLTKAAIPALALLFLI